MSLHEQDVDKLVGRFLSWKLPDSVCADRCATEQGPHRFGTNLLSAIEAKMMIEHLLAETPKQTITANITANVDLKLIMEEVEVPTKMIEIIGEVLRRVVHADTKHADDPMSKDDIPAAFGTIYNEISELRREVERKKPRPNAMRQEAIDAAAALFKFIRDICTTEADTDTNLCESCAKANKTCPIDSANVNAKTCTQYSHK